MAASRRRIAGDISVEGCGEAAGDHSGAPARRKPSMSFAASAGQWKSQFLSMWARVWLAVKPWSRRVLFLQAFND
jgi:hypothetical protein